MNKIIYRKCKTKKLLPAIRLMSASINHLRRQTGKEPFRWQINETPPFVVHLQKTDSDTFYCAYSGDRIVGFAGAIVRGRQWHLAWLFVHPKYQDKGIGRKLLDKVWRDGRNMTHSLCTFAFNTQAIGLYSKFGMAPLSSLPWMKADPAKMKPIKATG
ncbi:MAG: GNAT family N-acetyltransferase [candidate division Zixibacteria bacterium]|nr:GNAT family N-acetyltransferase [candidate division Zixibacteria bacterium]